MPKYVLQNRTAVRLHIPEPVSTFMAPYGTMTVEVPAAEMENAHIKTLVRRGLLGVSASDDTRLSDHLEVPVLSMITGGTNPTGPAGGPDLTGTYPNPVLTFTGVVAGVYGDINEIPVLTIDSKGRITLASTVAAPTFNYSQVTTNYNTTIDDVFIAVDASSGPVTVTLHAASLLLGKRIHVKKIDSTSNFVIVDASGVDTIDNGPLFQWNFPLNSYIFVADGVSKWWIT